MMNSFKSDTSAAFSNDDDRFDQVSITLHWLTVLLIIAQFSSIWLREAIDHQSALAASLLAVHRTSGIFSWFVVAARAAWRRWCAHLPPFPASMPRIQQLAAMANEYSLYILLLAMPITGLARVVLRGQPFSLFIWHVPALMQAEPEIRALFAKAHDIGATALLVLIGLHASAALLHRLMLHDNVMQRMLPQKLAPMKSVTASGKRNKADLAKVS